MEQNIINIPIEDIIPNRFQPRLSFEENGLKELADSIRQHGIIQPLVLRRLGDKYEIIAGERRYKASTMAGLQTVPAVISNIDDNQSAEVALVENIQRRNLTSIEEAKSYKNLLDRGYLTQEQLAEKMGVSQPSIANKLRLLNLNEIVQDALLNEKISERHARSLLIIPKEEQPSWLKKILDQRLTVRQLDVEIKKYKEGNSEAAQNYTPDINELIATAQDITLLTPINAGPLPVEPPQSIPQQDEFTKFNQPVEVATNKVPNKFFNFLEDEETNMEIEEPISAPPIPSSVFQTIDTIDSIDELDEFNEGSGSGNSNFINEIVPNNIIEVKQEPRLSEDLIDPVSFIERLDPNYQEKKEIANGLDLKTAINMVREKVGQMQNLGFGISVEEIDLSDSYQINIQIEK